jgi:hypothetical protein
MSEETILIEEAVKLAEKAQDRKVFNLADFVKGRSYPEAEVVIFLDDNAGLKIAELKDNLSGEKNPDVVDSIQKRIDELTQEIHNSALIFKMRGVSQEIVEAILKKTNLRHNIAKSSDGANNPEWMRDYITMLIGENIISVTNAFGEVDSEHFDFDKIETLRINLPSSEWGKLVEAMEKLTLAGGYFDNISDVGFLQKS